MAYDFWYWDGLPGRGEFVRLAFEAGGVDYRERARESGGDVSADLEAALSGSGRHDHRPDRQYPDVPGTAPRAGAP